MEAKTCPLLVYIGCGGCSGEIIQGVTPFQAVAALWENACFLLAQGPFSFPFDRILFIGFIQGISYL